jgi:hypothetical protein
LHHNEKARRFGAAKGKMKALWKAKIGGVKRAVKEALRCSAIDLVGNACGGRGDEPDVKWSGVTVERR